MSRRLVGASTSGLYRGSARTDSIRPVPELREDEEVSQLMRYHPQCLWLFILAVVMAQTLGLVHRVAHDVHEHSNAGPGIHLSDRSHAHLRAWTQDLFGSHEEGDSVCQLQDAVTPEYPLQQTGHGVAPAFVAFPPLFFVAFSFIRLAVCFQARAPPDSR
jgi:hypothetical protein